MFSTVFKKTNQRSVKDVLLEYDIDMSIFNRFGIIQRENIFNIFETINRNNFLSEVIAKNLIHSVTYCDTLFLTNNIQKDIFGRSDKLYKQYEPTSILNILISRMEKGDCLNESSFKLLLKNKIMYVIGASSLEMISSVIAQYEGVINGPINSEMFDRLTQFFSIFTSNFDFYYHNEESYGMNKKKLKDFLNQYFLYDENYSIIRILDKIDILSTHTSEFHGIAYSHESSSHDAPYKIEDDEFDDINLNL